jgi:hypothetical protein
MASASSTVKLKKYNIYAGMWLKLVKSVTTEQAAWNVIRQLPFGTTYHVTNQKGEIRGEFIPY